MVLGKECDIVTWSMAFPSFTQGDSSVIWVKARHVSAQLVPLRPWIFILIWEENVM